MFFVTYKQIKIIKNNKNNHLLSNKIPFCYLYKKISNNKEERYYDLQMKMRRVNRLEQKV